MPFDRVARNRLGLALLALFPRLLVPLVIFSVGLFLFSTTRTRHGRWSLGPGVVTLVAAAAFVGSGFVAVLIVAPRPASVTDLTK